MDLTKRCNACLNVKDLTEFHKLSSSPDGSAYTCKACRKVICDNYRNANKEKIKATSALWLEKDQNKAKSRENARKWFQANKIKNQQNPVVVDPSVSKTCNKCDILKPVTEFHRNATTLDGIHYVCKTCHTRASILVTDSRRSRISRMENKNSPAATSVTSTPKPEPKPEVPEAAAKDRNIKTCRKCEVDKPITEFYKDSTRIDGLNSMCVACYQQRYVDNKEHILATSKAWAEANKEQVAQKNKEWRLNNLERCNDNRKTYRATHKEELKIKRREVDNHKRATDPHYKLGKILRSRLNAALKSQKASKHSSAVRDLGCTIPEFKQYIESKWLPGMSWENHTIDGWHIDHIRPLDSFDLNDPAQQKAACRHTNLEPMWAFDNWVKHNKVG